MFRRRYDENEGTLRKSAGLRGGPRGAIKVQGACRRHCFSAYPSVTASAATQNVPPVAG